MGGSDEIRKASNACYRPSAYWLLDSVPWLLRLFLDPLGKNIRVMADGTPHVACDSHAQGFVEAVQKAAALRLLSGALLVTPQDFTDQERIIA